MDDKYNHFRIVLNKMACCCTYVVPKEKGFEIFILKALSILWCGPGLNRRHKDFQSFALPTELPHQTNTDIKQQM